jgi:hypothetical protein
MHAGVRMFIHSGQLRSAQAFRDACTAVQLNKRSGSASEQLCTGEHLL